MDFFSIITPLSTRVELQALRPRRSNDRLIVRANLAIYDFIGVKFYERLNIFGLC